MLKKKEEIENWLNKYEVKNFVINDDLTVDVNGDVKLIDIKLAKFSFQFGIINGDFDCAHNNLNNLKNCPREISGNFNCYNNKLTSLKYSPEKIGGDFDCSYNHLTSLKGAPQKVGGNFFCYNNKLTNLKYCPQKVGGDFFCCNNNLTSLYHCPKKVGGHFVCSDNNLISLKNNPKEIEGAFCCKDNKLQKKLLYLFNSDVKNNIISDFGNKEDFLFEVKKQKSLKEKEDLSKIIAAPENGQLIKKRL